MLFETQDLVIGYDEPSVQTVEFLHGAWSEDRAGGYQRNRKDNAVEEYIWD